jgi:hypothetical protein
MVEKAGVSRLLLLLFKGVRPMLAVQENLRYFNGYGGEDHGFGPCFGVCRGHVEMKRRACPKNA